MARPIVIYDSDCGFCKWTLALLLSAARPGALRPLPLGSAEADRLLADLTVAEREASWHLVLDEGAGAAGAASAAGAPVPGGARRFSAGAAFAPVSKFVRGGRLPGAVLARFPGAAERGYGWVAAHRRGLGRFVPGRARRWADRVIAAHDGWPQ